MAKVRSLALELGDGPDRVVTLSEQSTQLLPFSVIRYRKRLRTLWTIDGDIVLKNLFPVTSHEH